MTELQLWISAIEIGSFFALIALAYLLVLNGAGFFNFALGPYAMVGGLCASWLVIEKEFSIWPSVVLAILLVAALSVVTEVGVIRRIERRSGGGELPALIAVVAIIFAIQQAAGVVFGRRQLPGQRLVTFDPIEVGDTFVQPTTLLLVAVTVTAFIAVSVWIRTSATGRLLRAVGDNNDAARLLGLPVARIRLSAFVVSGVLAAIAGLLFAPKAGVGFESGLTWTISGFLALVVGGTGSTWAPLIGGIVLGGTQVFVPYYFGGASIDYAMLIVALVFFAFRPEGLFTRSVRA